MKWQQAKAVEAPLLLVVLTATFQLNTQYSSEYKVLLCIVSLLIMNALYFVCLTEYNDSFTLLHLLSSMSVFCSTYVC